MLVEREPVELVNAKPGDARTLALLSERAFHNDIHYGAPGIGGPPGYNSGRWQEQMIKLHDYFKILAGDRIVGGAIVFRKGRRAYELARLFLEPAYQNRGIGAAVLELLWQQYPLAKRWTLDTPAWNERTLYFYEKAGFVETGRDRRGLVYFSKG